MCRKSECPNCHGVSWTGCGKHISSAMSQIPEDKFCTCEPKVTFEGKQYPPKSESTCSIA